MVDTKVDKGEIKAGVVDNKSNIVETKDSPSSGAEKENLVFECKSCLAKFKKEKYLKEHKRNCQPNITKMALKVKLLVIFQSEYDWLGFMRLYFAICEENSWIAIQERLVHLLALGPRNFLQVIYQNYHH